MITDDLIRKRFIHDTISQGINQIYAGECCSGQPKDSIRTAQSTSQPAAF